MPPTQILKNFFGRDAAHLTAIDLGHTTIDLFGPSLVVCGVEASLREFGLIPLRELFLLDRGQRFKGFFQLGDAHDIKTTKYPERGKFRLIASIPPFGLSAD